MLVGMDATISLTVNGEDVALSADETTPLLYLLRNDLGLKSVRFGCGEGLCGSCLVLVDGRPARSCDVPLWTVAGKSVTTVEGLSDGDSPHPLVQALVEEQAGQCGYCLPGVVIAAKALLDADPAPARAEIAAALDGNLCRCGTHVRILRAVERAARPA
jgi:nicotinate dehydrogenase subunit A